jgi:hypothetical protein
MGVVRNGAPFRLGVELSNWWADTSWRDLDTVLKDFESALTRSGYITGLVRAYQVAGWANPYISIDGYSGKDFSSDQHLRDALLSVIKSVYPGIDYSTVGWQVEIDTTVNPSPGTQTVYTPSTQQQASAPVFASATQSIGSWFDGQNTTTLLLGGAALLIVLSLLRR